MNTMKQVRAGDPSQGTFGLRALRLPEDAGIVQDWVSRQYARYWGQVGQSVEQVAATYEEILRTTDVQLGFYRGEPAFLLECYRPGEHAVGTHYPVLPGDRGMHLLVAPAASPLPGFTWSVFRVAMDFLFSDPAVVRIVVEPDIRNAKIHALNRRAGFRYAKVLELPTKTAHLAFCTREQYEAAIAREGAATSREQPGWDVDHLGLEVWAAANRALTRKALAELSHERLLQPMPQGGSPGGQQAGGGAPRSKEWAAYVLASDRPDVEYRFRARLLDLDHWDIDGSSIERRVSSEPAPLDAVELVLDLRERLGISPPILPVYLEEITSTLYAAAYKHTHQSQSAADLVHASFQEMEAAMAEGHPAFIANSGRVGFDARDYVAYTPEAASPVRLVWVAAQRRHAEITTAQDSSYQRLLDEELGPETLVEFQGQLTERGLEPRDYLLLPVHPWQWFNKIASVFAADIATGDLICLGYGGDVYRAQQSIRTFFNLSRPERRYVKTALSVLNMGFMRGLSADYMRSTPPINDWLQALVAADPYFAECGFGLLREVAGVGYRNPRFEPLVAKASPYRKMLAALWRESPTTRLRGGQRAMTMAALLHRDRDGVALLPQLVLASGMDAEAWLERYLRCYLAPLLHWFYRHDVAFMPHGENVILVLEAHVPVGAFLKDIAEEAAIFDPGRDVPEAVQRICVDVPEDVKTLSIFTDVFDGFLRFLGPILLEAGVPPERFWQGVAECVLGYRRAHPELASKMDRYDLFAPTFLHSCLNRLQLRNNQQMVDLADPAKALQFAGVLQNPIAPFRHLI